MLRVYRYLTYFFFPLLIVLVYLRSVFNKEHKIRFREKIFSSHFRIIKDDKKKLVWFHAASIGECLSILPLIDELSKTPKINAVNNSSGIGSRAKKTNQQKKIDENLFMLFE